MEIKRKNNGRVYRINKKVHLIKEGGEGFVYNLPQDPNYVAKIYKKPESQDSKLRVMIKYPPMHQNGVNHPTFAWPEDLLYTSGNKFVGFVMRKVNSQGGFNTVTSSKLRKERHPNLNYKDLYSVALNLVKAFDMLHQKGYVVGDVNESNVMVSRSGMVTLVDTDSFQVPDRATQKVYRCTVFRPEYTPPELQGRDLKSVVQTIQHDLFRVSVLLFQLLLDGFHPFSGVPPKDSGDKWRLLKTRIVAGNFPFGSSQYPLQQPPLAPQLKELHPDLKRLFERCFEKQDRVTSQRRPSTREWKKALKRAEKNLKSCSSNRNHFYDAYQHQCPWCLRDQKKRKLTRQGGKSSQTQTRTPQTVGQSPSFPLPLPPRPKPPQPKITPGTWKLIPSQNNPYQQTYANMFGFSQKETYNLLHNGELSGTSLINVSGIQVNMALQGAWNYDINNHILLLRGYAAANTNMFGLPIQTPPQNFSVSFIVGPELSSNCYQIMQQDTGAQGKIQRVY